MTNPTMSPEERANLVLHPHHVRFGACVEQICQAEQAARDQVSAQAAQRVMALAKADGVTDDAPVIQAALDIHALAQEPEEVG